MPINNKSVYILFSSHLEISTDQGALIEFQLHILHNNPQRPAQQQPSNNKTQEQEQHQQ